MQRFNAAGRRAAPGRRRAKDKENWLDAKRIARELERVLEASGSRGEAIGRAAAELRLSTRQIFAGLLARYRDERTVSSVLARSKTERKKRLAGDVETIVASTLQEQWLIPEAPPLAPVVAEIQARCEEAGLRPPSYFAVRARAAALFTPEDIAKRRSANPNHLRRLKPRPGYIAAPHPLAVTQIDHTPTDIQFVEVVDEAAEPSSGAPISPFSSMCARAASSASVSRSRRRARSRSRCAWRTPSAARRRGFRRAALRTPGRRSDGRSRS